jgi:hypothetical protein
MIKEEKAWLFYIGWLRFHFVHLDVGGIHRDHRRQDVMPNASGVATFG